MLRTLVRWTLLSALLCSWLPAAALETVERTLSAEIDATGPIVLDNLLGSVHVVGSDRPGVARLEARVVAEAKEAAAARELAESVRLTHDEKGGEQQLRLRFPVERHTAFRPPKKGVKGLLRRWTSPVFHKPATVVYDGQVVEVGSGRKAAGLAVHVTLTVPYDSITTVRQRVGSVEGRALRGRLHVRTVDGLIAIERSLGELDAESDRADLHVVAFQGKKLRLRTADGQMELRDVRADEVHLETDSGSIRGDGVVGDALFATTASGDVKLGRAEPASAELTTGSGAVDLATHLNRLQDAVIRSESGDVTLRVGELTHFDLEAQTRSGEVKMLGGVELDLIDRQGSTVVLKHGGGGADVRVAAAGGNLTVRPYDGSRIELMLGK
jgi:hypothetical protein